jgi:hypothetical protein
MEASDVAIKLAAVGQEVRPGCVDYAAAPSCKKEEGSTGLERITSKLRQAWGESERECQVVWPLISRVGNLPE